MAPVSERSHTPVPAKTYLSTSSGDTYRVRRGDTLYSIAWRYGKDFRALARANNIGGSYQIYPGQLIKIMEAPVPRSKPSGSSAPAAAKPISSRPTPRAVKSVKKAKPAAQVRKTTSNGPIKWQWPAQGPVIAQFRTRGKINKGINIGANSGEPVLAAAPGEIVYAGGGLLGYGNLIIINHNERYLSAYAHNSRLLAKEGDQVKVGEKIAEIGNSGATQSMLHFEIRKDGKPVNPLLYLPKK